MDTSHPRESAKIYTFPARVRAAAGLLRAESKALGEGKEARVAAEALGAGWYHEAAIRDADRSRKP